MAELIVLRLVHVLGGVFWVGTGLFSAFFLTPVLTAAGPAAGPVMAGLQQRRLFTALPTAAVLTILSGARLMWLTSGGFAAAYFSSPTGATYAASGAAALVAFLLSLLVIRPAAVRAGALSREMATTPEGPNRAALAAELARLSRRTGVGGWIVIALLLFAATGMAIARYLQ